MTDLDLEFEELVLWLNKSFRKIDELEIRLDENENKTVRRFMADWIMEGVYNLLNR